MCLTDLCLTESHLLQQPPFPHIFMHAPLAFRHAAPTRPSKLIACLKHVMMESSREQGSAAGLEGSKRKGPAELNCHHVPASLPASVAADVPPAVSPSEPATVTLPGAADPPPLGFVLAAPEATQKLPPTPHAAAAPPNRALLEVQQMGGEGYCKYTGGLNKDGAGECNTDGGVALGRAEGKGDGKEVVKGGGKKREGQCEAQCEGQCEGQWEGQCKGQCEGQWEGQCEGQWEGQCEGQWEGQWEGQCEAQWDGQWDGNRRTEGGGWEGGSQ
ncbi:unnamed protein product [Closterium sp. Naga37s-1]|nr:unnamed protein product [Closterium sp. Naga37s-1]